MNEAVLPLSHGARHVMLSTRDDIQFWAYEHVVHDWACVVHEFPPTI